MTPSALPPIDQSLLPASVRNGSAQTKKTYTAALGFERMLVEQLAQQLNATAQPTDTDSDAGGDSSLNPSTDAATSTYQSLLPGALTDGLMAGGGLGLAAQLMPSLEHDGNA